MRSSRRGGYGSLKQRLRTLGKAQVLSNQLALRSTHSATQLKTILKQLVGHGNRIVVTEIGAEWPAAGRC
ncbi:MAG TPA: hypothetical protein VF767_09105 [Bryobacteraceae bacterium]